MAKKGSLAFRLVFIAALWSLMVLAVAGFVMSGNYEQRARDQFANVLNAYLLNLVAGFDESEPGSPSVHARFAEPRFDLFNSGFSWQVTSEDGQVSVSPSRAGSQLVGPSLKDVPFGADYARSFEMVDASQPIVVRERAIALGEEGKVYRFLVAVPAYVIEEDIAGFRRSLVLFLSVFGVGLVITLVMIVHFGLRPLARLRTNLVDVINGAKQRIEGDFPSEISPVSTEINRLIDHNEKIAERARAHVGNLAHGLKTPLSVILNETGTGDKNEPGRMATISEQAQSIQSLVTHHLERARQVAISSGHGKRCDVAPVAERLFGAMAKIHAERDLSYDIDVPVSAWFRGDIRDLEELLGNLADNASKWARSQVRLVAAEGDLHGAKALAIHIEDDGPGLDPSQRQRALQRGQRLDEQAPGTGLGLSIVVDLVEALGGRFELEDSPLGGLRASLILPGGLR